MKNSALNTHWRNHSPQHSYQSILNLLLCFIFGNSITTQAQEITISLDSTETATLYHDILEKTKCTGALSSEAFYALLDSYKLTEKPHSYFPSSSSSSSGGSSATNNSSSSKQPDTVFIIKIDTVLLPQDSFFRQDTLFVSNQDTVIIYQDVPNQLEVKAAQEILEKILEDKDLTSLIQEVVQDMTSEEISVFRKEMQEKFKDMNDQLKREQTQRRVAELESIRLAEQLAKEARKEARKEQKEAWDTLSKAERQELVQAKVALMAEDVGTVLKDGALAVGAAVGISLAVVGGVIAQGIIAIGKGIVTAAKAVWNWIDDHFYIRIDLSCAQQRKIKYNRQYLATVRKHRHLVYYKGNCPSW